MPFNPQKRSQTAKGETRGSHGRFVSNKAKTEPDPIIQSQPPIQPPPPQTVKVQVETPRKQTNANSDSLVSLNIPNPLTYYIRLFIKAINKPMTIKIPPLYAFPILIGTLGIIPFSFFGLGKQVEKEKIAAIPTPTPIVIIRPTATPAPVLVSRMGTIKATYQMQNLVIPPVYTEPSLSVIPSVVEGSSSAEAATPTQIPPTPTPVPTRYVLEKGETITFLSVPSYIQLSYYLNKRVLISGLYDKTKATLHISKSSDIEILP